MENITALQEAIDSLCSSSVGVKVAGGLLARLGAARPMIYRLSTQRGVGDPLMGRIREGGGTLSHCFS